MEWKHVILYLFVDLYIGRLLLKNEYFKIKAVVTKGFVAKPGQHR